VRAELASGEGWQSAAFDRARGDRQEIDLFKPVDYGTGAIRILAVEFLDAAGRSVSQTKHGEPLTVRVRCRSVTAVPDSSVTFCVGFARQGSAYQVYIYDAHLKIPQADEFVIDSRVDELRLGSGVWYVNLGVGAAGLFERTTLPYFSVDSAWYHLMSARLQLQVSSATQFDANGCFVHLAAAIAAVPVEAGRAATPVGEADPA